MEGGAVDSRFRPRGGLLTALSCPQALYQQPGPPSLPGFGHKPVLTPSGPRRRSLGLLKLLGEGSRRFPVTPSALFNRHLQISGWCLLPCVLGQRESESQRALGGFY